MGTKWRAGEVEFDERMPAMDRAAMDEQQRKAAEEMTNGPRGGVKGPFVPLLRSPELMDRLQRVGEYLRFQSSLKPRISEFAMLIVSREWTQHFEWRTHVPLARAAGLSQPIIDCLADARRPIGLAGDEQAAYDLLEELLRTKGVSQVTYQNAVSEFGERGVIDLLGVAGYFTAISMLMNATHAPPPAKDDVPLLTPFPL
jgi:4-carboxymuconolactone decarboxylase